MEKGDFIGREALEKAKADGVKRTLVGLESVDRGIPRDGYRVLDESGTEIGYVTSGSYAPFLKKNIALAYVPVEHSAVRFGCRRRDPEPAGEVQSGSNTVLQASEEAGVGSAGLQAGVNQLTLYCHPERSEGPAYDDGTRMKSFVRTLCATRRA